MRHTFSHYLLRAVVQTLIAFFIVCIYLFHFTDYTPPAERNVEDHNFSVNP